MVVASMAALCALGASFSTSAYELNPEVKDVTPALREASTVGVWTAENPAMKNAPNKDAVLVMTFGTTFTDTRAKTIDAVEAAIQKAHPDVPVFEAYTSHIIIDRVKAKEGIQKMTPEEAINAATINGAYAMGISKTHGSITKGKKANIIIDGQKMEVPAPDIISASRGTDIPAFYADWFFHRLETGYSVWHNQFNGKKSYISYRNTRFIVFWSKNPKPLLDRKSVV